MFDSGIGGLTVMREVMRLSPNCSINYFGDTARVPYGNKSKETITRYAVEISHFLTSLDIQILVVACNTVSAYALEAIQEVVSIPVVGVIQPGAKAATKKSPSGRIAVIGTRATIASNAYREAILKENREAHVISLACPLLVPLIEENAIHNPATRLILQDYLAPLKNEKIDTLLLGCTHYPLLLETIREILGNDIAIVDSAIATAESIIPLVKSSTEAKYLFFASDDPNRFRMQGELFLKRTIEKVHHIPEFSHDQLSLHL